MVDEQCNNVPFSMEKSIKTKSTTKIIELSHQKDNLTKTPTTKDSSIYQTNTNDYDYSDKKLNSIKSKEFENLNNKTGNDLSFAY